MRLFEVKFWMCTVWLHISKCCFPANLSLHLTVVFLYSERQELGYLFKPKAFSPHNLTQESLHSQHACFPNIPYLCSSSLALLQSFTVRLVTWVIPTDKDVNSCILYLAIWIQSFLEYLEVSFYSKHVGLFSPLNQYTSME